MIDMSLNRAPQQSWKWMSVWMITCSSPLIIALSWLEQLPEGMSREIRHGKSFIYIKIRHRSHHSEELLEREFDGVRKERFL